LRFQSIMDVLGKVNAHHILLLCHHNADPDALCSAYALAKLFEEAEPDFIIEIAASQGLSKLSKQILNYIPIEVVDSPHFEEADAFILLDTNTLEQLGSWKTLVEKSGKPLIVIDHHAIHPQTERVSTVYIVDERACSTCEIVFELFKKANVRLKGREALALFLGITYDTKHFALATSKTFKIIVELIKAGVKAEEAIPMLTSVMDSSERIARLKAAKRLRTVKMGEWLMVLSNVSSYQASAARALLGLGSHIAVVGGEREGALVISMRALKRFHEETGVHLGRDIAQPLGKYLRGMGGGHNTSAGVNGEGVLEDAFKECIRLLHEKLTS
jgi:phosphoesterase RecJ-like protein